MTESEIIKIVRRVMRQELAPLLMATVKSNESVNRSTFQRNQSDSAVPNARNIQPFGVASRAPVGTSVLTAPCAFDPTHLNMVGAFDESRPEMNDGETILYNAQGQLIYLKNGSIHIGSKTAPHKITLGDVLQGMLSTMLGAIASHAHPYDDAGTPSTTQPPNNAGVFTGLKSSPVDDGGILSQIVFTD